MIRAGALPAILLALSITAVPHAPARAQDKAVAFAGRAETIDAIATYAHSGGCDTLRHVFGPLFEEICKDGAGTALLMPTLARLQSLHALGEIRARNRTLDCEARQEISTGRASSETKYKPRGAPHFGGRALEPAPAKAGGEG